MQRKREMGGKKKEEPEGGRRKLEVKRRKMFSSEKDKIGK